ncbi:MAG: YfhO family protein [Proteobacteria bacterium]|nr:YfhO family protein [Pseudomonadota bacterium]
MAKKNIKDPSSYLRSRRDKKKAKVQAHTVTKASKNTSHYSSSFLTGGFQKLIHLASSNADFAAILAAVILTTIHMFLTGDYFIGSGTDIISLEYPTHVFATSWMASGVLPLWNPFIFGGVPFQAGVHGYLYPGWWTGLVLPTDLDIKAGILVHITIAALGGAWFARNRVESRIASFVAGATFALSAFTMMHLYAGHRVIIATASYLPWVAGAYDRAISGERRHLFFGIGMTGLMMLAGHYQVIFIGMGGLLAFALLDRLIGEPIEHRSRASSTIESAICWIPLLVGGATIAAVQLLPMFSTVELSQRTGGSTGFAASFSSSPANLLSFLLPNLYGNRVDVPFVGNWSYWESLGYIGLVPLILIAFGTAALPWRRFTPALIVLVVALVLTLGSHTPIFDLYLTAIPGADLFRSPGRFTLLTTLFGSLMAAQSLDIWLKGKVPKKRRVWSGLAAWLLLIGSLVGAIILWTQDLEGFKDWFSHIGKSSRLEPLSEAQWNDLIGIGRADIAKAIAISAATGFALTIGLRWPSRTRVLGIIISLILIGDLYHFGHRFLGTGPMEKFHFPERIVEIARDENGPGVRMIPPAKTRWFNFGAMGQIGNPGGYDIFIDSRYARYINRSQRRKLDRFFSVERLRRGSPLIRHLGPSYLLTKAPLKNGRNRTISGYDWFEPYKRIGNTYVYKDDSAPPRAVLVHEFEIIEDEIETFRKMEQSDFDIRNKVLVEANLPSQFPEPYPLVSDANEKAAIVLYEPNRVEIEVKAASQAVLVLSDIPHPGWSASVDGEDVPMVHANRVMRALPIPVGKHTVVMTYMPAMFVIGAVVSVASILMILAAFVFFRRSRFKQVPEQTQIEQG